MCDDVTTSGQEPAPSLALAEVRAVRPDAALLLADLLTHPPLGPALTTDPGRLRRADPDVQLDLL